MASEVGICNRALGLLGEEPILALNEDTRPGRLCLNVYADSRDATLRAHPWNFAIKRVVLAKLSAAPLFEFTAQFQLPTDCLRVKVTEDRTLRINVEGRVLLADAESVNLIYIARIIDTGIFDAQFTATFAARLAHDIGYALTGSAARAKDAWDIYQALLSEARKSDGQEGTPDPITATTWLDARL